MSIQDDFTVHPKSKVIRHVSGKTTVYDVDAFYSWLMDLFDEPAFMSYQTPIKYNTPTSFTMQNGWFLDNGDGSNIIQYLKGGSIDTTGYSTIDDPIYMLDIDGTTDFVTTDKDKTITDDSSDVGPLLTYKNDYPSSGNARIWVRDTNSNGTIADNSVIATSNGTGGGDAKGDSVSGDEIYCNIYTIATFPGSPDPQVYIFQSGERIAEWSAFSNWDRGSIDVLIPVKLGGSLIDSGKVTVYVRQTGDTFTYVEADLSSGSRTPVATETQADSVNITKGEWYLLYDNSSSGAFNTGDVIQNNATDSGVPPSWYAEVKSVTEFSGGTEGVLVLRSLRGSISDNDAIYVGTTQKATANGTPGDTYVTYDAETTGPSSGDLGKPFEGGTSGAQRVLRGFQDDGTSGKLVLQVYHTHGTLDSQDYTGSGRDVLYKDFQDNETLSAPSGGTGSMDVTLSSDSTTLISGYSDITVLHINGTLTVDSFSGTFTPGERVTWSGGGPAWIVYSNGTDTITLANVVDETGLTTDGLTITGDISGATCQTNGTGGLTDTNTEDFAFSLQSTNPYSVFIECGEIYNTGRDLDDVYAYLQYYVSDGQTRPIYTSDGSSITILEGQEYIKAVNSYTATKSAPFGTLAGGVLFGAQGVWVQGMDSSDSNNIKLTDHNGVQRQPYVSVNVTVSNTRTDDDITVYLKDPATGLPKKDQYTSHATLNTQSASVFHQNASGGGFPNDTPTSGTFIVVATDEGEEHRYRYISWDNTGGDGDDGKLTLAAEVTGTAEAGTSGTTLFDTGNFASGVQRGDIIRNTTDASWGYIISIDSDDQVTTTVMRDSSGSAVPWEVGDGYEINSLVQAYDDNDTFFIPYMDTVENSGTDSSPGSETVQLTYVSDRPVLIRVRNVAAAIPIQPFITSSSITSSGMTVSVIRNKDEVYS